MFAAATNLTSLFGKSSSLSAYTLHSPSASPASSSANLPSTASSGSSTAHPKSFNVGLWKVLPATHKTTAKDVSVWVFEKRVLDGIKDSSGTKAAAGKEWVLEQLKKEVSSSFTTALHTTQPRWIAKERG
jgi:SCY1-like protein 2